MTKLRARRYRTVSNIMGIALGLAMTIGMAGAVTYFVTQETSILTTQESFIVSGTKLTKIDTVQILSLTLKNTGTSVLENPMITVHNACVNSGTKIDNTEPITQTINPGASYSIRHEINTDSCNRPASVTSATSDIDLGSSYIVDIVLTAAGTNSEISDTFTVTARS